LVHAWLEIERAVFGSGFAARFAVNHKHQATGRGLNLHRAELCFLRFRSDIGGRVGHEESQRKQSCESEFAAEDGFTDRPHLILPLLSPARRVLILYIAVAGQHQQQPVRFRTGATMPALELQKESALALACWAALVLASALESAILPDAAHRNRRSRL